MIQAGLDRAPRGPRWRLAPRRAIALALWLAAIGCRLPDASATSIETDRLGGEPVPVVVAQAEAPAQWSALSPTRRSALAPLRSEWSGLDDAQRLKWIEVADRFPTMSPESRERMQARMSDWARLSPEERGAARLRYREAQRIDPQERRARWQEYQSLSPEDRQRWIEKSSRGSRPSAGHATPGQKAPPAPLHGADPATLRAPSGATTTLIDPRPLEAPSRASRSRVVTSPALVDRDTLLPRSGPQATTPRSERGRRSREESK